MTSHEPHEISPRQAAAALALTCAAGFVDAFGYLTLSHVYTANLSGNTVLVGVHVAAGDTPTALLHTYTIGMFLLGLLASGVVIELGLRRRLRRMLAPPLALELICLGAFALLRDRLPDPMSGWPLYGLIALAAFAMGVQNTSIRMAGILTIYTTHVTGAITRFSEQVVEYVFALFEGQEGGDGRPAADLPIVALSASLWLAFLGGAVLASRLAPGWGARALLLPIGVVLAVGGLDCVRPLARPRERTRRAPHTAPMKP